ncbi:MAG: hypothetical protein INQ03_09310 [Candidatus Heimdallarchaeota archaeon]|nr:hypothetical protein [Candidatus Heimdallarchaeota archaeon]
MIEIDLMDSKELHLLVMVDEQIDDRIFSLKNHQGSILLYLSDQKLIVGEYLLILNAKEIEDLPLICDGEIVRISNGVN